MDCFNKSCPFRVNESSNLNRCECTVCPNRTGSTVVYSTNSSIPSNQQVCYTNNTTEVNKMDFNIYTLNDNGSGMKYCSKEAFLNEVSSMIDDCITNGGKNFTITVDADASCFLNNADK